MLRRSARQISSAYKYRPTTIPPLPRPVAHGQQLVSPTTYGCPPWPHSSGGSLPPPYLTKQTYYRPEQVRHIPQTWTNSRNFPSELLRTPLRRSSVVPRSR